MSILPHNKFKSSMNPNKVERNFYKVWSEMKRRCTHKTYPRNDKSYFDKGIKICDRWTDFNNFFIDIWDSYKLHRQLNDNDTELDRINNKKGYSKINCRWATRLENMNNIGNNKKIKGKTLSEWSEILNVKKGTLARRQAQGWSDKEVLFHPFGGKSRNKIIN
jgi:hypothetical protein